MGGENCGLVQVSDLSSAKLSNFNESSGAGLGWSETSRSLPAPRAPKAAGPRSAGPGRAPGLPGRSWIQEQPSRGGFGRERRRDEPPPCREQQLRAWHQHSLVSASDPRPSFSSLPADFLLQVPAGSRHCTGKGWGKGRNWGFGLSWRPTKGETQGGFTFSS